MLPAGQSPFSRNPVIPTSIPRFREDLPGRIRRECINYRVRGEDWQVVLNASAARSVNSGVRGEPLMSDELTGSFPFDIQKRGRI